MKSKTVFTEAEVREIKKLIRAKCAASTNDQKKIRNKIRKLGFYFSDFSDIKGYNVCDFEELIDNGSIMVVENTTSTNEISKNRASHEAGD